MTTPQAGVILRELGKIVSRKSDVRRTDRHLIERFLATRDEGAFAALVERHGPMVLGVCRRVLHHVQDAEDAFQATFLILARRARSIRRKESAGGWLYQVAYHVAIKTTTTAPRRPRLDDCEVDMSSADPMTQSSREEIHRLLDEELQRLPEQFRSVLVLCHLEGLTQDDAATQLGWSKGTLRRRLGKARELLRLRLVRRGVTLSAALVVSLLEKKAVAGNIAPALARATVRAALGLAAGKVAAGLVTERVASLVKSGVGSAVATKAKLATGIVLVIGAFLGVGTMTQHILGGGPEDKANHATPMLVAKWDDPTGVVPANAPESNKSAMDPASEKGDKTLVTGQVLDPQGKPVGTARVAVLGYPKATGPRRADNVKNQVLAQTSSDSSGRFRLLIRRPSSDRFFLAEVVAASPGYGLRWEEFDPDAEKTEVTLRLENETPHRGRIVDLQGSPGAGVKIYLANLGLQTGRGLREPEIELPAWPGPVSTDRSGRFVFHGIGPSCQPRFAVRDDRFAHGELKDAGNGKETPGERNFVLSPAHVLSGRITYADSGKPVADAQLLLMMTGQNSHAKTDANGRYQIPISDSQYVSVYARPPTGRPYLTVKKTIEWPKGGVVRQTLDLALPRGIVASGKVADSLSGKPIGGAEIQYFPQTIDNADYREDIASCWHTAVESDSNGMFQMVLPPGPGHFLVEGPTSDYIFQETPFSMLIQRKREFGAYQPAPEGNVYFGGQRFYAHATVPVRLKKDKQPEPVPIVLRRGVTVRGRLIGADGKPVRQAWMTSRLGVMVWDHVVGGRTCVYDGHFELRGCDPDATYRVVFYDSANQQGGVAELAGRQAAAPVTVQLAPCGTATARLIGHDKATLSRRRATIDIVITPGADERNSDSLLADVIPASTIDWQHYREYPRTDERGRVTLPALIPGATYRIGHSNPITFRAEYAGKTQDWGDIYAPILFAD